MLKKSLMVAGVALATCLGAGCQMGPGSRSSCGWRVGWEVYKPSTIDVSTPILAQPGTTTTTMGAHPVSITAGPVITEQQATHAPAPPTVIAPVPAPAPAQKPTMMNKILSRPAPCPPAAECGSPCQE